MVMKIVSSELTNDRTRIPRTVWALGLVSLFMDVSSEMIHALLPLFLTASLGASVALVGIIEGVAESTTAIVKVFSGYLSDRFGRRKPLILFGYGLGAISKPFFALAGTPTVVFAARFADRIGKGVRGAPRDALVADVTPEIIRGRAYGLRQAMDTCGAFIGPLLAIALMSLMANDMRKVFWFAAIPGGLAVLCVLLGVQERPSSAREPKASSPIKVSDLRHFAQPYWNIVAIGVVFTLARFSEAFLVLKAHEVGLPLTLAPLVLVVMNVVYSIGAYPAGAWSDHASPTTLLLWGLAALIVADLLLAFAPGLWGVFVGISFWGMHMALTQGLLSKLLSERAPEELRGSAFGLFNLTTGLALLAASVLAGYIWNQFGSSTTFVVGAVFAVLASLFIVASDAKNAAPD